MIRSAVTTTIAAVLGLSAASAFAQMSPVGLWQTISDKDGKVTSEVRIVDNGGVVSGKIERVLDPKARPDEKCDKCEDDRKNQENFGEHGIYRLWLNPE